MKRFTLGFVCLLIYTIFSPYYPDSYYLTDEYEVRTRIEKKKNHYAHIYLSVQDKSKHQDIFFIV